MQKWEYMFVKLELINDYWRPMSLNGEIVQNWTSGPPAHEFANKMGEEGWELVEAPYTIGSNEYGWRLIFKRSK